MKRIDPPGAPQARRPAEQERKKEPLLYVEDDDDNWTVTEMRLRSAYDLTRAATAEEACRTLCQRGPEFAAILMDIELRGSELNGVQLTELLRGRLNRSTFPVYTRGVPVLSTPVLFVTAHGAKYSDTFLLNAGGNKVIPKPVNFGELTLALTQLHLARVRQR